MNFLKSAMTVLIALAIVCSFNLADDERVVGEPPATGFQSAEAETSLFVSDLMLGVSILPAPAPHSSAGYKVWLLSSVSNKVKFLNDSFAISYFNINHSIDGIPSHSLLIISAFHSFW